MNKQRKIIYVCVDIDIIFKIVIIKIPKDVRRFFIVAKTSTASEAEFYNNRAPVTIEI